MKCVYLVRDGKGRHHVAVPGATPYPHPTERTHGVRLVWCDRDGAVLGAEEELEVVETLEEDSEEASSAPAPVLRLWNKWNVSEHETNCRPPVSSVTRVDVRLLCGDVITNVCAGELNWGRTPRAEDINRTIVEWTLA